MSDSGAKFVGRNRPPRVQISYETEIGNATKKVDLPFIMGVMSDLKGKPQEGEEVTPVADREFDDVDVHNFDSFMNGTKPRATFRVPNKLSDEEGELPVDLTFTSLDDFTPGKIAEKVAPLNELLQARNQLKSLLTFLDGRQNAEKLLEEIMENPALLKSLSSTKAESSEE